MCTQPEREEPPARARLLRALDQVKKLIDEGVIVPGSARLAPGANVDEELHGAADGRENGGEEPDGLDGPAVPR